MRRPAPVVGETVFSLVGGVEAAGFPLGVRRVPLAYSVEAVPGLGAYTVGLLLPVVSVAAVVVGAIGTPLLQPQRAGLAVLARCFSCGESSTLTKRGHREPEP